MQSEAQTPAEYLQSLPGERKQAFTELRNVILYNLPAGFEETMSYGMLGYVVPHSLYAPGYPCDPRLPLPFINLASQKNFIALYHMGLYADSDLLSWFTASYSQHSKAKLDMGKSCIRFQIPFVLIGELAGKMTAHDWIALYEDKLKR